jgi:hypothetical protein
MKYSKQKKESRRSRGPTFIQGAKIQSGPLDVAGDDEDLRRRRSSEDRQRGERWERRGRGAEERRGEDR